MKTRNIIAAFLLAFTQIVNAQVSEQVINNYKDVLKQESAATAASLNEDFHAQKPSRFNYWALEGYVGNSTRPTSFCEMQVQGWSIEVSGLVNHFNGFTGFGPSVGLSYKTRKIRVGAEYAFIVNRYNETAATPNKKFQSHKVSGLFGLSLLKSSNATRELELIGRVTFLMDGDDLAQEAKASEASISLSAYQHTYALGGGGGLRYTQRFKHTPFYLFAQATGEGQGNLTYTSNKIQFAGEFKIGGGINLEFKKKYNKPALRQCELDQNQLWEIYKSQKNSDQKQIFSVTK